MDSRFSDEKLAQFHQEFKDHVEAYTARQEAQDERIGALIESQHENTKAISCLIEETKDVIQLHKDLQGAARVGRSLQGFGAWLAKWGVIGIGLASAWNWGLKNFTEFFVK